MAMEFYKENNNEELEVQSAVLKVIGLGGGGGNAVNYMASKNYNGVEFICANTDAQALDQMNVDKIIPMGSKSTTKGLGAGMLVEVGEAAALEDREIIKNALVGTDMLFIAAGMGGGTGTGSAPVVANIAKEEGILTVAVVTRPFFFEGKKKRNIADEGINKLLGQVDSLIILPNDKLAETLDDDILEDMDQVFAASDDVLTNAVTSITELISQTGKMNIDFADVKTVMSAPGKAMMGSGTASGEDRGRKAVEAALSNPLIEGLDLNNAKGILVNISGKKISMRDHNEIGRYVENYTADDADVKVGQIICDNMPEGEIKVTIVATGLSGEKRLIKNTVEGDIQNDIVVKNIADNDVVQKAQPQDLNLSNDITTPAYIRKQKA